MADVIDIEIDERTGEVLFRVGGEVSPLNHSSADKFRKGVAEALGGETRVEKIKDAHHHHHGEHGHGHKHEH